MTELTNLPSKIVRAVRFYLVSTGAVDFDRAYHHFDTRIRAYNDAPIQDILIRPVGPAELYTGNESFVIELQTKFNAVPQPGQEDDATRIDFDALVGRVRTQMLQSDDRGQTLNRTRQLINQAAARMPIAAADTDAARRFARNNADMADFTLLEFYQDIYGMARSEEVNWALVQRFRVTACESAVEGYF